MPRKAERYSMHLIPLSTSRQPLKIVDTTFVIKPEETVIKGHIQSDEDADDDDDDEEDDEPNGTYRATHPYFHAQLLVAQAPRILIDSHPNIPARLCFSPTMIQDVSELPGNDSHESTSPSAYEHEQQSRGMVKTLLLQIDQNRTRMHERRVMNCAIPSLTLADVKHFIDDNRRFGQTFLLDVVKTEQIPNGKRTEYIRPMIPDDDVVLLGDGTQQSITSTEQPSRKRVTLSHTTSPNTASLS